MHADKLFGLGVVSTLDFVEAGVLYFERKLDLDDTALRETKYIEVVLGKTAAAVSGRKLEME
jgi:hypothetical protein